MLTEREMMMTVMNRTKMMSTSAMDASSSNYVVAQQSPSKRPRLQEDPNAESSDEDSEEELEKPFKQTDLALVVEKRKIYVNKETLKSCSPVFKSMLESGFREKNQKEIRLPDKNYKDMVIFLRCMLPYISDKITVDNALQVIPLADEYQVVSLRNECERVIERMCQSIFTSDVYHGPSFITKCLEVSDQFAMPKALSASIVAASYLDMDALCANENYGLLNADIRQLVSKENRQLWENLSMTREKDIVKVLENMLQSAKYMPRWKKSCEEIILERCREVIRDEKGLDTPTMIRFLDMCNVHHFVKGLDFSVRAAAKFGVRDFDRHPGIYSAVSLEVKTKVLKQKMKLTKLRAQVNEYVEKEGRLSPN